MAITTSEARRELSRLIERVNLDRAEGDRVKAWTRGPEDEYDALVETGHLLRSPANAHRLRSAWDPPAR